MSLGNCSDEGHEHPGAAVHLQSLLCLSSAVKRQTAVGTSELSVNRDDVSD